MGLQVPIVILTVREQKHLNHCGRIHIFPVYNNCRSYTTILSHPSWSKKDAIKKVSFYQEKPTAY